MERRVTSNPNTPLPPSSLRTKLPASESAGSVTALEREPPDDGKPRTGIELWLHRLTVLMFVLCVPARECFWSSCRGGRNGHITTCCCPIPGFVNSSPVVLCGAWLAVWECSISGSAFGKQCTTA